MKYFDEKKGKIYTCPRCGNHTYGAVHDMHVIDLELEKLYGYVPDPYGDYSEYPKREALYPLTVKVVLCRECSQLLEYLDPLPREVDLHPTEFRKRLLNIPKCPCDLPYR